MAKSPDFLTATGIGVSNLKRSIEFYTHVLGMTVTQTIKLDHMEEVILTHEGRNAIVLMHWIDGSNPNYANVPVKLVFYVTDPKAVAQRVREVGCEVTREPEMLEGFGIVGLNKDPDGYVVELLLAPSAQKAAA